MAMPRALVTRLVAGSESMDQPTTLREKTSSTTAQYTLPSRVGCSVRLRPCEVALDQIPRRGAVRGSALAGTTREALDACPAHQGFNRLVSHGHASAEDQLGLHPSGAV